MIAFLDRVTDAVRAIPGVEAAGITDAVPLDRDRSWGAAVPGQNDVLGRFVPAFVRVIGSGYFSALQIPLLEGRTFDNHDIAGAPKTVIINQSLARALFPGRSALDHEIFAGGKRRVIGIAGDAETQRSWIRRRATNSTSPMRKAGSRAPTWWSGTSLDSETLATALRKTIWSFAPIVSVNSGQSIS